MDEGPYIRIRELYCCSRSGILVYVAFTSNAIDCPRLGEAKAGTATNLRASLFSLLLLLAFNLHVPTIVTEGALKY